jgi:hypothetical protein
MERWVRILRRVRAPPPSPKVDSKRGERRLNSGDIIELRLHNQHLRGTPRTTPESVVGWLGAMQAQEFPVAKWSVAQRADGIGDDSMDQAFASGAILRTHILRPTWHFVLPADIRWMLKVSAPRVNALNAYQYRKLELDEKVLANTDVLLAKALGSGEHLTRREIAGVLERSGVNAEGLRLGYILMRAELDGIICSGIPKGKQQTYASLDERAPEPDGRDRDEALIELTRRFFLSRGPATLKDFLTWSSLTVAEGRAGLAGIGSDLVHEKIEGRTYWFADSAPKSSESAGRIDLLQGYDEYIMSYKESRDVMWEASPPPPDLKAPVFTHAIVQDGRLVGHWRRVPKKGVAAIESFWYRPPDEVQSRSLTAAIERFGNFLGVPAAPL